jgi:hypothetical protein
MPDWEHIVFGVPVTGSIDEALEKGRLWSQQLRALIPRSPQVFSFVTDFVE